jgi:hypothetical protein
MQSWDMAKVHITCRSKARAEGGIGAPTCSGRIRSRFYDALIKCSVMIRLVTHSFCSALIYAQKHNFSPYRYKSYIYLGYFVCVCVCVCVSQFVSERSAILLVLAIKLMQGNETDGFERDG